MEMSSSDKENIRASSNSNTGNNTLIRKHKLLEEDRVKSFKFWQYDDEEKCGVKKMAEAGFYYSGHGEEDDSVTCFACSKVLDGWERTDDPWKEHKKHAPNCPFVKLGRCEHELTVEEMIGLSATVLKNFLTNRLNKKLPVLQKRAETVRDCMKNPQF